MSNYSKIYWLTRLDYLQGIFIGLGVSVLLICAIIGFYHFVAQDTSYEREEKVKEIKAGRDRCIKRLKLLIPISVLLFIVNAFIPSKNEAILIMAGGKTLDYVQKDTSLAKVPFQTTAIISEYLDKTLKEMKEDKK